MLSKNELSATHVCARVKVHASARMRTFLCELTLISYHFSARKSTNVPKAPYTAGKSCLFGTFVDFPRQRVVANEGEIAKKHVN